MFPNFFRRDSFVTHRAFCDVLTDDRIRASRTQSPEKNNNFVDESNHNGEMEVEVEIPARPPVPSPSATPAADVTDNVSGSVLPIQASGNAICYIC